ncbi:helix-turn-helix domain-containing protein [Streptomyces sp. NPDC055632]
MSSPVPDRYCSHCHNPLPPRAPGRGRPSAYCGRPCRQAAYRDRHKDRQVELTQNPNPEEKPPKPPLELLHAHLFGLAENLNTDARHLVRLLQPGPLASAVEYVETAVQIQRRLDALVAGLVLLARTRHIPWDVLAHVMKASPETLRKSFHIDKVERLLVTESEKAEAIVETLRAAEDIAAPESPPPPTVRTTRRVSNQLAPVLSQLHRSSGMPLRALSLRVRVSASYLSRILAGEKIPTLELTERIGQALGADCEVLRKVWADEKDRTHNSSPDPATGRGTVPNSLVTAVRYLHRRANRPALRVLAAATGNALTEAEIRDVLRGARLPDWNTLQMIILALDGEPSFFHPLWERAAHDAEAAGPTQSNTPHARVGRLMSAFGGVLGESDRYTTSRRSRELRHRLAMTRQI